ncbi:MAG: NAD(P)-binding protein [Myxococcales bacterium]|nr:NAD(P)-binding protein [Myxococcales bacterium]
MGIVGAGFAGLVCADRLAAKGVAATLHEAADRVGGRARPRRSGRVLGVSVDGLPRTGGSNPGRSHDPTACAHCGASSGRPTRPRCAVLVLTGDVEQPTRPKFGQRADRSRRGAGVPGGGRTRRSAHVLRGAPGPLHNLRRLPMDPQVLRDVPRRLGPKGHNRGWVKRHAPCVNCAAGSKRRGEKRDDPGDVPSVRGRYARRSRQAPTTCGKRPSEAPRISEGVLHLPPLSSAGGRP